ncbi:MAG: heterodisulfide reductase-related iron-sulfur binding cluster, partial [Desulfobulbaceae bacterium]|nr:heterodisulfide reductase-related iron-sulfur binding cluster [Desulfobulbaceae bacterium]
MDLAYYPGYSLYQSAKLYNHQTKLVFGILDLKLIELEDWSCCGATSAGKINDFMAVALPARNLGKAESTGRLQSACYSGPMNTRFPYDVPISDNVENPQGMETVLKAIGVTALDWNYKILCCGASSIICNPDNALDLIAKIMRDALSMGSDCLVVNCPMCQ